MGAVPIQINGECYDQLFWPTKNKTKTTKELNAKRIQILTKRLFCERDLFNQKNIKQLKENTISKMSAQVILFACSKCFSRHPFEELSTGQQLCKVSWLIENYSYFVFVFLGKDLELNRNKLLINETALNLIFVCHLTNQTVFPIFFSLVV